MIPLNDEEDKDIVGKKVAWWMGEMRSFVMLVRFEGKVQSLWVLGQMGQWEFDVGEWFKWK